MIVAVEWDLQRILAAGSIVLTVVFVAIAIVTARRPRPVRVGFDLARLAVSIVSVAAMTAIVGVSSELGWVLLALGGGLLLGTGQGWFTKINWRDGRALASRTVTGIVVWAAGVVVMQVAGVLAQSRALQIGQAVSWFGVGVMAGTIAGRQPRIERSALGARAGSVVAAVLVVAVPAMFGVAQSGEASAQADAEWVLVETQVNPDGDADPVNWVVTATDRSLTVVESFGPDDLIGAEALFEASWTAPPTGSSPALRFPSRSRCRVATRAT